MIRNLIVLAALLGLMLAPSAQATARWQYYGADHAYPSKEAAKKDLPNVLRRAGWPPKAIAAIMAKVNSSAGQRIEIRKDDPHWNHWDFMRSGALALWRDMLVDFVEMKGVHVVAPADYYSVEVDGLVYEIAIPDVCNNISGRIIRKPMPVCRIVNTETRDINEVALHYRYESDDECWGYREAAEVGQPEGVGAAFVKPGPCPNGPCDFSGMDATLARRNMQLIGTVPVKPGVHQFRVSAKYFDHCIEYVGRGIVESSFSVRVRPDKDYRLMNGQLQAHIYYFTAEMPKGMKMNDPFGLFSWVRDQEEADRIRAAFVASK